MAEAGQAIVTDPRSGEILAMASYPPLDPNSYQSWFVEEKDNQADTGEHEAAREVITPAVAGLFEPGSTFKVLTMAAGIDSGSISPEDIFVDTGEIEVGGSTIRNWDNKAWGPQTMVGCLRYSLNVCLAYVASQKIGGGTFYAYLNAFGIGQLTGVDMASEIPGQLRTPRHPQWTESDLGTNAFGQGVSVTPMQLLAAVSAIANDGVMIQPHIVRQIVGPQGAYWPKPTVLGRPISAETARTVTDMLIQSLEGETRFASLEGYRVAGKTGTAQVPTEIGYDPRWTIASFIGWGPVGDPRFMIFVRLDKPGISPWGAVVAAPLFHDIASRVVVLEEIPPAKPQAAAAGG
jgi:cell division protein FtsI (penicillin-binding protein 3)